VRDAGRLDCPDLLELDLELSSLWFGPATTSLCVYLAELSAARLACSARSSPTTRVRACA
jgi:hypothetical protein